MGRSLDSIKNGFLTAVGYIVAIIFFGLILLAIYQIAIVHYHADTYVSKMWIITNKANSSKPLLDSENKVILKLAQSGTIVSPENLMGQLVSFYDTLVAFLIGIIALFGISSFLFIKFRTHKEMQDLMKEQFNLFIDTSAFRESMDKALQNSDFNQRLNKNEKNYNDFSEEFEDFKTSKDKFINDLETLKAKFTSLEGSIDAFKKDLENDQKVGKPTKPNSEGSDTFDDKDAKLEIPKAEPNEESKIEKNSENDKG